MIRMKLTPQKLIILCFIAGILGAGVFQVGYSLFTQESQRNPKLPEVTSSSQEVKKLTKTEVTSVIDFTLASSLSTPSVVFIKTVSEFEPTSIFDLYFGGGTRRSVGTGSGVIFSQDGYIVTNYHVIENADKIEIIHNKKSYIAKIIGTDPSSDLAILKIDAKNLPAIKLGRSKDLQVGEWVIAVGNPFNLTSTVTAGIVSAKGRNIQILGGQFPIESFIQTDAAINPGNSGGALVNIKGELVGINTAILSKTGSYTGYGFAVPVDIVAKIFNDIVQYGKVQKAFSGIEVSDLDSKLAKQLGIDTEDLQGAVVIDVQRGSSAAKAGIQEGDVIIKINQEPIEGKSNFDEQMSYYRPGDKVKITYKRGKQILETQLLLTNQDGTTSITKSQTYFSEFLGAELEPLSKIERERYSLNRGVRIGRIRGGIFGRMANHFGLREGFIITSINRNPVSTPTEVEEAFRNSEGNYIIEGIHPNGSRQILQFYYSR
ncbi:MAG: trypsin-like peptidase domain-containing protein [Microscillaceae bacterium]|nr:trypsin-like peptidase domain-containing protein [Microscillaceae bacterium]MDW8461129.1 trypsin-like peptidase domain-containing protein [Cytophagales bacterium]